ncbi:helix-turn-helix domain-containing protein [Streptomyces sp. 4N509B]|uniref:helix-turn-helix domain-containing protein n=1 Tax=Streptomyces sp. 4N509B TaxID=3457413 RepID=UPI003FD2F59D
MNESRERREDIAALLMRVMSEHGLSQKDIADQSGVPFQTISAWIGRKRKPSLGVRGKEQLRALAGALPGVSVAEAFEAAGATVPAELDAAAEERILLAYRSLSPARRRVAHQVLETLAAEE